MNSGIVLAWNDGFASMAWGCRVMLETGAISWMKLKLSF
jgi:hypothetical protein